MKTIMKTFKEFTEQKLNEEFGDMAEFKVGAERVKDKSGKMMDEYNVQLMIHDKVIVSKKVHIKDKLYEELFDYVKEQLEK